VAARGLARDDPFPCSSTIVGEEQGDKHTTREDATSANTFNTLQRIVIEQPTAGRCSSTDSLFSKAGIIWSTQARNLPTASTSHHLPRLAHRCRRTYTTRDREHYNPTALLSPPTFEDLTQDRHPRSCSRAFRILQIAPATQEND
jgi:hypothetical protein